MRQDVKAVNDIMKQTNAEMKKDQFQRTNNRC